MNNNIDTRDLSNDIMSEPRVYELGYLLIPTVDEGDLQTKRDALVALITKASGIVIDEGQPELIDLAYSMTKMINNKKHTYDQGYFGWIKFDVSPERTRVLSDEAEAHPDMLRSLLVKTERENIVQSDDPLKSIAARSSYQGTATAQSVVVEETVEESSVKEESAKETSTDTAETAVNETKESSSDDLTKIEGIGPKIADVLVANGITTFAELSASKVGDLRTILADNDLASHEPKTWSKQATLAKNEKWDKLAELQEELKGGREA
jgi:predicted flap endonuclease-1-like 5' DNA nuclease